MLVQNKNKNDFPVVSEKSIPNTSSIYPSCAEGRFDASRLSDNPDPMSGFVWPEESIKMGAGLHNYYLYPVKWSSAHPERFHGLDTLCGADSEIRVMEPGVLELDFGVESAAWLEFEAEGLTEAPFAAISEYNQPGVVNEGAEAPLKYIEMQQDGSTWRLSTNREHYEGVRFAWIDLSSCSDFPITIRNVRLACQTIPVNYKGSFLSDNTMFNKIWGTAAYSVKLNLLPDYIGAILMERSDRHSWTGDAYVSQAVALYAFGHTDLVAGNIRRTIGDSNGIATYSLYWIQGIIDYVMVTGDDGFLQEMLPQIREELEAGFKTFNQPAALGFVGHDERIGACFENTNIEESQWNYRFLFLGTCKNTSTLMEKTKSEVADWLDPLVEQAEQFLRAEKGEWFSRLGLHSSAEAINAGAVTDEEALVLFERNMSDPITRISLSPFNEYFILNALARIGKFQEAIDSVQRCWGGQIELGATTFWEVYRPSWNSILQPNDPPVNHTCGYVSLCHPWSSGVLVWMANYVLGIQPEEPGFRVCTITPNLLDLNQIEGSVPTPHGAIHFSLDKLKGQGRLSLPEGVSARLDLSENGMNRMESITLNGEPLLENQEPIPSGDYEISVVYATQAPAQVEVQAHYPLEWETLPAVNMDSWREKWGRDGWVLFNWFGVLEQVVEHDNLPPNDNSHLVKYPEWIEKVSVQSPLGNVRPAVFACWSDDARALPHPESKRCKERRLGAVSTNGPHPCRQSFTVDIECSQSTSYELTLYMVDWDRLGSQQAVEVLDLKSGDILAPVALVEQFEEGALLRVKCDRSVRLRICSIYKHEAVLSGIFFKGIGSSAELADGCLHEDDVEEDSNPV